MKFIRLYSIVKCGKEYGPYAYFKGRSLGSVYSEREVEALDSFIEVVKKGDYQILYVLFSGGRDSLVALHLAWRIRKALNIHLEAVHVDTTVSTPGNIDYVKTVCDKLGINLVLVRPKESFFELVERWGFPTATRRWCCYHLKIEPLKRYFMTCIQKGCRGLIVDGIRADESPRRRNFPRFGIHKHFKLPCYHPIFDWTKHDVIYYIEQHSLPDNPLYQILPRATECWCTALKTPKQFMLLKKYWPELFKKFVEAEAKLKTGGSALFRNGKRIYLRDL